MNPEQALQLLQQLINRSYSAGVIKDIQESMMLNQAFDVICKNMPKPAEQSTNAGNE